MFVLNDLLNLVIENGASDLHITVGTPPVIRVDGELIQTDLDVLTPMDTRSLIYNMLTAEQQKEFEENFELDLSYSVHGFGRFRVNVYKQRGCIGAAFRIIPTKIPTLEELRLPEKLREAARLRLENPESSLIELSELMDPPIGKSGINHRFKKIEEIAEKIRLTQKKI